MTFRLDFRLDRRTITVTGSGGLLLLFCIFSLPSFFAASLDPQRAEKDIRQHLKWQLSSRYMADLRAAGLGSPDVETATRLKADYEYINRLEFASVQIRHFIFVPPFTSSRLFVVKAVLRDAKHREQIRYFSFSARNKFFDFFWVAEQSRFMWLLSI
jgi:hypothetical protein